MWAIPIDGSAPRAVATNLGQEVYVGAVDSTHAFLGSGPIPLVATAPPVAPAPGAGGWPLAVDDGFVYSASDTSLRRQTKDGSETIHLAEFPLYTYVATIAVDDAFVYWSDASGLLKTRKVGGPTQRIGDPAASLALDASCIYSAVPGGIRRAPK